MKKRAKYIGYSSHDCETWYQCPCCNRTFGSWSIFCQDMNENGTKEYCPYCKEELDGLK